MTYAKRSLPFAAATLLLGLAIASCGGRQKGAGPGDFECKDRRAMYVATGSLVYAEQGIRLSCEGNDTRLEQYFVATDGKEKRSGATISRYDWEKAWEEFDNAGWRMLEDCDNPGAGEKDPIYTFEISDGDRTKTVMCKGIELPFPYDRLRNALDIAAASLPPIQED
jgi:hypothetical protein